MFFPLWPSVYMWHLPHVRPAVYLERQVQARCHILVEQPFQTV